MMGRPLGLGGTIKGDFYLVRMKQPPGSLLVVDVTEMMTNDSCRVASVCIRRIYTSVLTSRDNKLTFHTAYNLCSLSSKTSEFRDDG